MRIAGFGLSDLTSLETVRRAYARLRKRIRRQPIHMATRHIDEIHLSTLSPLDTVRLAYKLLLRRDLDPVGLEHWTSRLREVPFDMDEMIYYILESPEFKRVNRVPFMHMVHRARVEWVGKLRPFDRILDIGGSSPTNEQGALIDMGYRHRPKQLTIFDLPPDRQFWGKPHYSQDHSRRFDWGTVEYVHGEAEQIAKAAHLDGERFDMIFMGQAIEHLWPEKLPAILKWIREHLTPGGSFVIDTPNRILTVLQNPNAYINADHKIEYTPAQLANVLEQNGFEVYEQWGLVHMPRSQKASVFDPSEIYDRPLVSERVDECYLFALHCRVARS
jgi:SAM-dependent methyltransferase